MEPGLEILKRYSKSDAAFVYSNACHLCTVEIDPHTGAVVLLRYIVSEDCGVMINPSVVEGQIAGGAVQGIGGALLEDFVYDEQGNPLTTTFLDYSCPLRRTCPRSSTATSKRPPRRPVTTKASARGARSARRRSCQRGERCARACQCTCDDGTVHTRVDHRGAQGRRPLSAGVTCSPSQSGRDRPRCRCRVAQFVLRLIGRENEEPAGGDGLGDELARSVGVDDPEILDLAAAAARHRT